MNPKEKGRSQSGTLESGRGKQSGKTSRTIVRQSGDSVNRCLVFPCRFLLEVYLLLAEPVTIEQLSEWTESPTDRILLALNDLTAAGVRIIANET